ncbi:helix-turn-helix domain-containing protein [Pseudonocardia humida]|uniref:Helix-turn-helix domain-containing protein n=1 Tax=Pseudonocardia humida TaxID=2800819 RepID=A0ABT1A4J8_9PSEU|nr:helix-turn-helix domain-containing protein [Pseudonocardia humida]MCO1657876.1 helix-turn-helix domain-containing protein [Pseudonocardia humida]
MFIGTDVPDSRILLSVEDAAGRLSISRTRMYALIKAGEIASIRVGRLRRIPSSALESFIERLTAEQIPQQQDRRRRTS